MITRTVCAWCFPPDGSPDDGVTSHGICPWHLGMQRLALFQLLEARRAPKKETPMFTGLPLVLVWFSVVAFLTALYLATVRSA